MTRISILLSALALSTLAAACNNTKTDDTASDSNDSVTSLPGSSGVTEAGDTGTTVEEVPGASTSDDSEAEEVPAADEADSDKTEDAAGDTTVEEEPTCEYVTSTWSGDIALRNQLVVSLHDPQPSYEVAEGVSDVLILDFKATDPDCTDILVTGFSLRTYWTDNAGTGWYPTWVGTSIDGELIDGVGLSGGVAGGTAAYPPIYEPFIIPAGETVTVTFSAEMYGASAEEDDAIRFGLYVGSLGVYDGENLVTLHNDSLDGNTLVF